MMNMKALAEAMIGDTLHHANSKVEALEGFKPTIPMVYAAAFPLDTTGVYAEFGPTQSLVSIYNIAELLHDHVHRFPKA